MKTRLARVNAMAAWLLMVAACHAAAQTNVTWGAAGLPPGLSIQTTNAATGAGRIVGTPTSVGNFQAVVYPIGDGQPGDMMAMTFAVLPAGDNTAQWYLYRRVVASGGISAPFIPLAGGGGRVYGNGPDGVFTTTNGTTFAKLSAVPSAVAGQPAVGGAVAGLRVLLHFGSPTPTLVGGTNGGTMTNFTWPTGMNSSNARTVASDGSLFYVVERAATPANTTVKIWNGLTNWTLRSTLTMPPSVGAQALFASVAKSTNNVALLALRSGVRQLELLRSANGGTTWASVTNTLGIGSVAFGNGFFLGSGSDGTIYRASSGSGTNWVKVNADPETRADRSSAGSLMFAGTSFFSSFGASRDGSIWVPFREPAAPSPSTMVYGGNTNLVFVGTAQASIRPVPTFLSQDQRLIQGTAVNLPLRTD